MIRSDRNVRRIGTARPSAWSPSANPSPQPLTRHPTPTMSAAPPSLILVDGCNVLHVEGVLPAEVAGIGERELAELIARSRYRRVEALIVMDGPRGGGSGSGAARIVASGPGRTADEVIVELVRKSSVPRSILVVTSDRGIQRAAAKRRCRILSSEAFLAQLGRDAGGSGPPAVPTRPTVVGGSVPRPTPSLHSSTAAWIAAFGVTESDLSLPTEATEQVEPPPAEPEESTTRSRPAGENPSPGKPGPPQRDRDQRGPASSSPSPSKPEDSTSSESPRPRRRPLEDVRSLDEVDPAELERFDMGDWIDGVG